MLAVVKKEKQRGTKMKKLVAVFTLLFSISAFASDFHDNFPVEKSKSKAKVKTNAFKKDIRDGTSEADAWSLKIRGRLTNEYRYQFGLSSDTDCLEEAAYSE